jgi:hypothetical protein
MQVHEQKAHFQAKRRERASKFASNLRHELERSFTNLDRDCETEEERRDVHRLWTLMNQICAKHRRKAEKF